MDLELTPRIKEWMEADPASRSVAEGAELLLRINKNRILYANIMRNPEDKRSLLEYHLAKEYKKRLLNATHEEVAGMMKRVEVIATARNLAAPAPATAKSEWQAGKRADHDELPDEVKALYEENRGLIQKMRDAHTRLRLISPENSSCPDSDRYPICKALLSYDAKYRDNWNIYDNYKPGTKLADTEKKTDRRTEAHNAAKTVNLLLGKYMKQTEPDRKLAQRILDLYAVIPSPTPSLVAKMEGAGLI